MIPMFRYIAGKVGAIKRCEKAGNTDWYDRHTESLLTLMECTAPSGSGIDRGTEIDLDASGEEKLVFTFSYHRMNENGMYVEWLDYKVTVRPSLLQPGFTLKISGKDRDGLKDYLYSVYGDWLESTISE